MLEKEHHLYKHDAGVYKEIKDVKDKERLLVERVEDILEKEAREYIAVFEDNKRRNDGRYTPRNDNVGRTA